MIEEVRETSELSLRLGELEAVIERGLATFVEVGLALAEIRDSHLYRQEYTTFGGYVRERWGFTRDWAYEQIEAASVVNNVGTYPHLGRSQAGLLAPFAPAEQRELAPIISDLTVREARAVLREHKARKRVKQPSYQHRPAALPVGRFATVVVDPPWRYENRATRAAAEDHYPTLSLEELSALKVPAADDAHLYLWVTTSMLREGLALCELWGFDYKTLLTWVKPQIGLGNYFRIATEHVIFGVRGSLGTNAKNIRNWFEAPRTRHSEKPSAFYELVERASPGPYLEMFAREVHQGWSAWGNEV